MTFCRETYFIDYLNSSTKLENVHTGIERTSSFQFLAPALKKLFICKVVYFGVYRVRIEERLAFVSNICKQIYTKSNSVLEVFIYIICF